MDLLKGNSAIGRSVDPIAGGEKERVGVREHVDDLRLRYLGIAGAGFGPGPSLVA
jgi:hypothetical protein